jgi:hypothetical protein
MHFTAIVLLALPLVTAVPPKDEAASTARPVISAPLDRDAFNAVKRQVVLELPKGE